MNRILEFTPPADDGAFGSITIEGGATYSEVAWHLGKRGALRNMPSCPQFTVAGAIATATHGSGIHHQNLAADVSMLEFVRADGSLVRYSRGTDDAKLCGARVHMGALGVVSALTLDVVPYFEVAAHCYVHVPLDVAIGELPRLWTRCDSLSVWTAGFGTGPGAGTCWMVLRHFHPHWDAALAAPAFAPLDPSVLGESGVLLERSMPRYCTDVESPVHFSPTGTGPWASRLCLTADDEGRETSMAVTDIQAEFFVRIEEAQAAIRAVWACAKHWSFSSPWGEPEGAVAVKGLVDAMEFRQIKGDGAWLSPHAVDSLGIHISFNGNPTLRHDVMSALERLETVLLPFDATAHWGKLAPMTFGRSERLYGARLEEFRKLCEAHDPNGKFRNAHVQRVLFGGV